MSALTYLTTSNGQPKLSAIQPQDPSTACTLEYLNEGGANVVFRILPEEGYPLPKIVVGKLLRVRKDLPHVQSTIEQVQGFERHFKPLFPSEHVVQHSLLQLAPDASRMLNRYLRHVDRPFHRAQTFLSHSEDYGILITDMTPIPGSKLLQFKPKWLCQSPNAPANAKRCRTCALRAQRTSQDVRTATDEQASCPLALISEHTDDRQRTAEAVTSDLELRASLALEAQPLLHTLRWWQVRLDPGGVLSPSADEAKSSNICKAMTLRDCTLFVRRSDAGVIELRLGDLDLKQAKQIGKWEQVEQSLIDGGWYMHSESKAVWVEERICLLSRT